MSASFPKPAHRKGGSSVPGSSLPEGRREADSGSGRGKTKKSGKRPDKTHTGVARQDVRTPGRARTRSRMDAGQERLTRAPRPAADPPPYAGAADAPPPEAPRSDEQTPLLPGLKPVLELLLHAPGRVDVVFLRKGRHSRDMEKIVDLCRGAGVRFALLEASLFARVYAGSSQGVVARLYEAGYVELDALLDAVMDAPLPLLVALDQVRDPGNAGALARTLYAMGGAGLIVPRHNGVYLGAAAGKAAAGALERLPVSRVPNLGHALDAARDRGFTIYGATAKENGREEKNGPDLAGARPEGGMAQPGTPPILDVFDVDVRFPALLTLGGEESGIRPGTEKRCDALLSIPLLREFDSLNVAQAGGILVSCFVRQILGKR